MTALLQILFYLCLAVVLYLYAGYPLLIYAVSRLRPRPVEAAEIRPPVTLVIPAYNEEGVIEAKLRNSLALDYPEEMLEILVASDGSDDATEEIASTYADRGVRLLRLPRRGKAAALDDAVEAARGEIVAFTDANAMLEPPALKRLVANFADPGVGGVCGNKVVVPAGDTDATERGEGLYWRYDKWQKRAESRAGSIFASDGTLHAVRKELYVPVEDPAQADDIAISTRIVLQGRRLVFEPGAVAVETAPAEGRDEFQRKVRVTNHSVRALLGLGRHLWTQGLYSVELVSHKLLRHLSPFFLVGLLVANAALLPTGGWFPTLLALQLAFYAAAACGYALRHHRIGRSPPLSVPYYFALVNAAALVGVLSILGGVRLREWTPRGGLAGDDPDDRQPDPTDRNIEDDEPIVEIDDPTEAERPAEGDDPGGPNDSDHTQASAEEPSERPDTSPDDDHEPRSPST